MAVIHLLGAVMCYSYVTDYDAWNMRDSEQEDMGKTAKWIVSLAWELVIIFTLFKRMK